MGLSQAFLCRGGRGSGGATMIAECDRPSCSAVVFITSAEEYSAAAAAGWRRQNVEGSPADVRCPAHAADHLVPPAERHDPACPYAAGDANPCSCSEITALARRSAAERAAAEVRRRG